MKDYLVGNMYLELESSDELANFYGIQEVLKRAEISPQEFAKKLRAVTSVQIKKVANQIFVNRGLNMALIGPIKKEKQFKKIFKL